MTTAEPSELAELAEDFDPTDPRVIRDPYPVYAAMRASCPVGHGSRFGGFRVITRYADVCRAAHDTEVFSSAQGVSVPEFGNAVAAIPIEVDPPEHTRWRHLIQGWFSPQSVALLEPDIRAIVNGYIDTFAERGRADLADELAVPVPPIVTARLLGLPAADGQLFRGMIEAMLEAAASEDSDLNAEQAFAFLTYTWQQLEDRRAKPCGDLLSQIVELRYEGRELTEEELLGLTLLLAVGGQETTVGGIGLLLLELARQPELQDRLRHDPERRFSAIEEGLRLGSPIQYFSRTVTRDTEIGGVALRAGEKILLSWASANHDPDVFADAESFVCDRPNNRHIAFGSGPHRCVGIHLARLEMRVVLDEVLRRLPTFRLEDPDAVVMAGGQTYWVRSLPVVW